MVVMVRLDGGDGDNTPLVLPIVVVPYVVVCWCFLMVKMMVVTYGGIDDAAPNWWLP